MKVIRITQNDDVLRMGWHWFGPMGAPVSEAFVEAGSRLSMQPNFSLPPRLHRWTVAFII